MVFETITKKWNAAIQLKSPRAEELETIWDTTLTDVFLVPKGILYGGSNLAARLPLGAHQARLQCVQSVILVASSDYFCGPDVLVETQPLPKFQIGDIIVTGSAQQLAESLATEDCQFITDIGTWKVRWRGVLQAEFIPTRGMATTHPEMSHLGAVEFNYTGRYSFLPPPRLKFIMEDP